MIYTKTNNIGEIKMINQPTIEQLIDEITLQKQTKMRIDSLSRALIQNLYIPYCGDLYFHLKLTKACDNHTAIKRWVNEKFTEIDTGDFDSNYRILKQQLLAIDPAYA